MPDGSSRFSIGGEKVHHYMGCSTFSNFTVLPEIAVAKIREDAPFDKVCYIGCGVTTGIGAVINTAKVEPGANVVVFGLGGIGLNVIQGARLVGAEPHHRRRCESEAQGAGAEIRDDALRQPEGSRWRSGRASGGLTDGGADYSFECVGNVPR
jgi:S-(hydroxymethyl)glutathione dehydrogenase/alcohol dehydrogenase